MKNIQRFLVLSLIMCMALAFLPPPLLAQGGEVVTTNFDTPDQLFGSLEVLYGALVILGGYLQNLIPPLRNVGKKVYRVLAFAILAGIAFVMFGANAIGLIITYALSTSVYEIILKWIIPNKGKDAIKEEKLSSR